MPKKLGLIIVVIFAIIAGGMFNTHRAQGAAWCCFDSKADCSYDDEISCKEDCNGPQKFCVKNTDTGTPPGLPEPKKATFAGEDTQSFTITNPLSCDNATCLVQRFIDQLNRFAAIIIVIIFFWSAIQFAIGSSLGDDKKISQAKSILLYGVIGYAVILLSKGAVDIITSILKID